MIAKDKLYHFIGGVIIGLIFSLAISPLAGFAAASIVGVGKEVWDSKGHGTPDTLDAVATIIGGAIPAILLTI